MRGIRPTWEAHPAWCACVVVSPPPNQREAKVLGPNGPIQTDH